MNKLKVMTIVGTRPELIRLSCILKELEKYVESVLVHTGQNYDYELNEIFFDDLDITKPKYYFDIKTTSVATAYSDVLLNTEKILTKEKPDAIMILGDTNSAISALIARRMKIPIYHLEAGNRSFDDNIPEEINRRVIDHISDFNLAYTEHSRRNLLNEGCHPRDTFVIGSPLREVYNQYKTKIEHSKVLKQYDLEKGNYFLVSTHREENVDSEEKLRDIICSINAVSKKFDKKVIFSLHPRTKKRLESIEIDTKNIIFTKPLSYTDYCNLQTNSFCVLSDSGTISEESSIMNFPAVTIRNSMERPEALDAGSIVLSGIKKDAVLTSVNIVTQNFNKRECPHDYISDNVSNKVISLIVGTCGLRDKWKGIEVEK